MSTKRLYKLSLVLVLTTMLSGCFKPESTKTIEEDREDRIGKITGEEGIVLFGGNRSGSIFGNSKNSGVNINLWQASVDALSSIGVESMDRNSGTIVSKWYNSAANKNERIKVNIFINGGKLDVQSIRVSSITEKTVGGKWVSQEENIAFNRELEEKILRRARHLKINN